MQRYLQLPGSGTLDDRQDGMFGKGKPRATSKRELPPAASPAVQQEAQRKIRGRKLPRRIPVPDSDEAFSTRCGTLDPVLIAGEKYWLEARFVDHDEARQYAHDRERPPSYGLVTCYYGGCSGQYAVWCHRDLTQRNPGDNRPRTSYTTAWYGEPPFEKELRRLRRSPPSVYYAPPAFKRNREIPYYWIAGQYNATEQRRREDDVGYRLDVLRNTCNETDRRRCPPPSVQANLSDPALTDWRTPITDPPIGDNTNQLPDGVPEWAAGPLLTAAGIIAYLLARKLLSR